MSSTGVYRCCDDLRRESVLLHPTLNGIDYLEVVDSEEPVLSEKQRKLEVHFVKTPPAGLNKDNVIIDGGERVRGITVDSASIVSDVLIVHVTPRGDFSTYTLRLVETNRKDPLKDFDPRLVSIDFSFKVECPSDLDCRTIESCPPEQEDAPHIDYLARDYATFRRLMLDRLSLLLPGWGERTPADFGVTMVELLAYVADQLSYRQDAIATEAYLRTARSRLSVRRHARLVDYVMHDGCNARAFVHVRVTKPVNLPAKTQLFSKTENAPKRFAPNSREYDEALRRGPVVFETMQLTPLDPALNRMDLYAWHSQNCCLPRGATSATLLTHLPLAVNDLVLFRERVGPRTGNESDADPEHRHVVRLTGVDKIYDPVGEKATPAVPIPITEIRWDAGDALPFPLCISTTTDQKFGARPIPDVSIAQGNIVIADHGISVVETFDKVPKPTLFRPADRGGDMCSRAEPVAVLPRFRPRLGGGPLTQVARVAAATADAPEPPAFLPTAPASDAMRWSMQEILPEIHLTAVDDDAPDWEVRHDLLESNDSDAHFVAEVEEDGIATLRFGDDEYGRRPKEKMELTAHYRIGNGTAGNVGIGALQHIVSNNTDIESAVNYTPARCGVDPEALEHARQSAPEAFRIQERAVTEADYAEVTERHPDVDRAAATFRWTGSWYTLFDTIDRHGGGDVDPKFEERILAHVDRYRQAGTDLEIDGPRFVSLEIALTICVLPGYFRSDVRNVLLDIFSGGLRRDGSPGFFHPDNFTFGQPVILSAIIAAAASVDGVDAVFVNRFRRQGSPSSERIDTGILPMTRLEIARLENDRNFPDHGVLTLTMRGGM